jgi:uncharacterized protein (DUF433 family)
MLDSLIDDRGRLIGTRITVLNLMPYFLDEHFTEQRIAQEYHLTLEQVGAARAYALAHAADVLEAHAAVEDRIDRRPAQSSDEHRSQVRRKLLDFKAWLEARRQKEAMQAAPSETSGSSPTLPSFRDWLTEQASHPPQGT